MTDKLQPYLQMAGCIVFNSRVILPIVCAIIVSLIRKVLKRPCTASNNAERKVLICTNAEEKSETRCIAAGTNEVIENKLKY